MKKLFALAAALLLASGAAVQAATVTFILDQSGAPGSFELRARASGGDNFGIASYGVDLVGATNVQHVSPNVAFANGPGGPGAAGFTFLRSADGLPAVSASQDTIAPTPNIIRGFGQSANSFAGLGMTPLVAAESPEWQSELLIATGNYSGAADSLNIELGSVLTLSNVFVGAQGTQTEAATIGFERITGVIPEPATLAMAGMGLVGMIAAGRRRK